MGNSISQNIGEENGEERKIVIDKYDLIRKIDINANKEVQNKEITYTGEMIHKLIDGNYYSLDVYKFIKPDVVGKDGYENMRESRNDLINYVETQIYTDDYLLIFSSKLAHLILIMNAIT